MPAVDNVHHHQQNSRNRFLMCVAGFFLAAWALFALENDDNRLPFFGARMPGQEHTYWRSVADTTALLVISVVFLVLPYVLYKSMMDYWGPFEECMSAKPDSANANAVGAQSVEDFIEFA